MQHWQTGNRLFHILQAACKNLDSFSRSHSRSAVKAMSPAHRPIHGIHTHVCVCGIPEHFQNTQSFEHDNKVLAFHNVHARNNNTRCISRQAFYVHTLLLLRILLFQRKTNAPQRTRVHAVPTDAVVSGRRVPFWNPKPCRREAKGCRHHNFIRHSSKPIKFYTQVTVASLRLSPQQMFTLSGVALVLDCLLCWAGT